MVAGSAQPLRSRHRTHRWRRDRRCDRESRRISAIRGAGRTAPAEWPTFLHVRRPRSGLVSRGGMSPTESAVSRAALRQRQGDGPQHAALPRQDSRSALFRSRRPARSHCLARYALHGIPRARDTRGLASRVPNVGRNARASSLDRNLDPVQRGMGYRSRRQSGRPALADRDLRLGEAARPRQPACRQFPLLSAQLPPQDRHRGFPLV